MGEKLRRMVMKRKALCDLVVGAANVQGPGIGDALSGYLSGVLADGESLPDLTQPILLFGRKLKSYGDAMVEADGKYLAERAKLVEVLAAGRAPMRSVKDKILSLRSTCQGLFGEGSLRPLGLDFNLAQDVRGVLRQAEIIRERVAGTDPELVSDLWVEGVLDREKAARRLDPEIEELRGVVERLVEQGKRVDTAKVRKDQTLKDFDRNYVPIAQVLEATFRVAGETELADRIRPTVRQLERNDDDGEGESAEPAATPEPEPAPEPESGVSEEASTR